MATTILTQERLKELLQYDPNTGIFTWRVSPRANVEAGRKAGTTGPRGYVTISLKRRLYRAHRLAWLYVYGVWPEKEIDHINRCPSDNRITNLRPADRFLNTQNVGLRRDNASGHRGVGFQKGIGKWRARIQVNKQKITLGCFADKKDAIAAYQNAAKRLFNATADL